MADAERTRDTRLVYRFGGGLADGSARDADLLGGKGANLAEMAAIGLPVPPGFTLPTTLCARFAIEGERVLDGLVDEVKHGLHHIEQATGKRFGDPARPLLVSVRSGAGASMPGMMDTVLDLGLNDATVAGLAAASGDARFAWDSYRRFIQMYAELVLGLAGERFEEALEIAKEDRGLALDTEMTAEDWRALVGEYSAIVEEEAGRPFPQGVHDQLRGAIGAVFGSWRSKRATVYRGLNGIAGDAGTAVTVQAMVFGNRGDSSATGVGFTRDPSTGERMAFGEFLVNAQGEDVVAGLRTPRYLTRAARVASGARALSMEEAMPGAYAELAGAFGVLERHYRDMQDVEFTVEQGRLWLLQTRAGKRTVHAELRIAVDMANEALITRAEAISRIEPAALAQLLQPTLDPAAPREVIARGLPASPGAASGTAVFDADTAVARAEAGEAVILIRAETSPNDIAGMHAARGIVTARGGMTSHAAVVARGMGRPCVTGVTALRIDAAAGLARYDAGEVAEGDAITLDGATGEVMRGVMPTIVPALDLHAATLLGWADDILASNTATNATVEDRSPIARLAAARAVLAVR